ncbi:MAG: hypothetical protein ACW99R_07500 [Candidatus Hodarchaeales archaeon]
MSTISNFSWTRMEGIGLILTALGIAIISQIPSTFFVLYWLEFDLDSYLLTMTGVVLGTTILLTTISCSLTEDWDKSKFPTLKTIINTSLILTFLSIFGFFIFFVLQPSFPPEMRELDINQRYLAAQVLGLTLIAILMVIFYKGRAFFSR